MSLTYLRTIHYILMTLCEGFQVSDCCDFDYILYSNVHVEVYASLWFFSSVTCLQMYVTYTSNNPLFNILKSTYLYMPNIYSLNGANKTYLDIHCLRVANTILFYHGVQHRN